MELRTLRRSEREALLELLDHWELPDGWRGRDFFRRYLEDDPTFADENVWVASASGNLVSCVQIFPRQLRISGQPVPTGGIGSVFTLPEYRRSGIAGALLERAVAVMAGSGLELSLLFAARIPWYTRLGWRSWPVERSVLRASGPARSQSGAEVLGFEPDRDLSLVKEICDDYSGSLDGTVIRDERLWIASLANAGNPHEDFRVARRGGELLAYARATVLEGFPVITEYGRRSGAPAALADLLAAMVGEYAVAGNLHLDLDLQHALEVAGLARQSVEDKSGMLRCLDGEKLAARLGLPPPNGAEAWDFLKTLLPAAPLASVTGFQAPLCCTRCRAGCAAYSLVV
jgi:GNAT superfamily N-acetyltransferase